MEKPIQTQAESQRARLDRLKAEICAWLECTPEQYAEFQYKAGLQYLKHYLPNDKDAADMLSRSRVFWDWWRNHWANRDEHWKCLTDRTPVRDRDLRVQLYTQYHDGKELAHNIHPNSTVLNESYALMIQDLIKTERLKA